MPPTDRFLNTAGGADVNLSNGTTTLFGATIGANNLDASQTLKTDSLKRLISTDLVIADVTGLQAELDILGGVWNRVAPNVSFDNGTDKLAVTTHKSADGIVDQVFENTMDAQDNIKTDQISESTGSANITMNQKTIHSGGIQDTTLTPLKLVKTDASGNFISATDINPHLTAGTNINFTGTDPLTINNDNTQALNTTDTPFFVNTRLTSLTGNTLLESKGNKEIQSVTDLNSYFTEGTSIAFTGTEPLTISTTQDLTLTGTPSFNALNINLPADDTVNIDSRVNPNTSINGAMRQDHTAGIDGSRAHHIDMIPVTYNDTRALTVRNDVSGSSSNINPIGLNLDADITGTTNAHIDYLKVSKVGAKDASMVLHGYDCREGICPVHQHSGSIIAIEKAFLSIPGFTDVTTLINTTGIQCFVSNNDYLYIGKSTIFSELEITNIINASNPGITPVFEYSQGSSSWNTLVVTDNTDSFKQSGNILITNPGDWATETVSGSLNYWMRIQRTSPGLATPPTITSTYSDAVIYEWDCDGDLDVRDVILNGVTNASRFVELDSNKKLISSDVTDFIDDDSFATASATTVASSESIKVYADNVASLNNPGGANTNVQFNSTGSFGGTSNFTWTGSAVGITGALLVTGDIGSSGGAVETNTVAEYTGGSNITMTHKTIHSGGILDSTGTAFRLCHYDVNKNIVPVTALTSYILDGTYIDVVNALNGDVTVNSTINQNTSSTQAVTFNSITSTVHNDDAICFFDSNGKIISEADELKWIPTTNRLMIGQGTPAHRLEVITQGTTNSEFHYGEQLQEGFWISSVSDSDASLSAGARLDTGSWIAQSTDASIINFNTGTINFFANNGLTDGVGFSPTAEMIISTSNVICNSGFRIASETASTIAVFDTLKNVSSGALGSNLTLTTGTLDTIQAITTASSPTFTALNTDTITEKTTDAGVIVETVHIEDGSIDSVIRMDIMSGTAGGLQYNLRLDSGTSQGGLYINAYAQENCRFGAGAQWNGTQYIARSDDVVMMEMLSGTFTLRTDGTAITDSPVTGNIIFDCNDSGFRLGGSGSRCTSIIDDDTMTTATNTVISTSESIKTYINNQISGSGNVITNLITVTPAGDTLNIVTADTNSMVTDFKYNTSTSFFNIAFNPIGYTELLHQPNSGSLRIGCVNDKATTFIYNNAPIAGITSLGMATDQIDEFTENGGVTIDSFLLKDDRITRNTHYIEMPSASNIVIAPSATYGVAIGGVIIKAGDISGTGGAIDLNTASQMNFTPTGSGQIYFRGNVSDGNPSLNLSRTATADQGTFAWSTAGVQKIAIYQPATIENELRIYDYVRATDALTVDTNGTLVVPDIYANTVSTRAVYVDANGVLGTISSLQAHKMNIQTITGACDWVYDLNPVKFNRRVKTKKLIEIPNPDNRSNINGEVPETIMECECTYTDVARPEIEYGFIAEDVELVNEDIAQYNDPLTKNDLAGVNYNSIIAGLVGVAKAQKNTINILMSEINTLKLRVSALEG